MCGNYAITYEYFKVGFNNNLIPKYRESYTFLGFALCFLMGSLLKTGIFCWSLPHFRRPWRQDQIFSLDYLLSWVSAKPWWPISRGNGNQFTKDYGLHAKTSGENDDLLPDDMTQADTTCIKTWYHSELLTTAMYRIMHGGAKVWGQCNYTCFQMWSKTLWNQNESNLMKWSFLSHGGTPKSSMLFSDFPL